MKKVSGVYGIKNTANEKWYIGQSINIYPRKFNHIGSLRSGTHYNKHLQSSFTKYGEECFEFIILEECNIEMLDVRERAWIEYYKSTSGEFGYNQDSGGKSNQTFSESHRKKLSYPKSEETKAKMRRPKSEILKRKISEAKKGKCSDKVRAHLRRMSDAKIGIPLARETRTKMSLTTKGRPLNEAQLARNRANALKMRGIPRTEEYKLKMSIAQKERLRKLNGSV